jgi:hypothetical protein
MPTGFIVRHLLKQFAHLAERPLIFKHYLHKYSNIPDFIIDVILKNENELFISAPGQPLIQLIPYKPRIFHTRGFADMTFEFIVDNEKVVSIKQRDPPGEYELKKN